MSLHLTPQLRARIARLGLPHLGGRRVLVVGSDAAVFARFAEFQLASSVLAARADAAPDQVPSGLDVIVMLDDAARDADVVLGCLPRFVDRMAAGGVLVLECAVYVADPSLDVPGGAIGRADLEAALAGFAVKRIGASQPHPTLGDGFYAEVHHVARRLPVVCLMMAPPGYGKTSLAQQVFGGRIPALPVIGADSLIHQIARDGASAGAELRTALQQDFSPLRIDEAVERIVSGGLVDSWVDAVLQFVAPGDFVLEGYFPARAQEGLVDAFRDRGYLAVRMDWERPRPESMDAERVAADLDGFMHSLDASGAAMAPVVATIMPAGNIDTVSPVTDGLVLRGWAVTAGGCFPDRFEVTRGRAILDVVRVEIEERPDVRDHLGLPHARIGFRIVVCDGGIKQSRRAKLSIRASDGNGGWNGPLHWSR